jgi:hypothetical protein
MTRPGGISSVSWEGIWSGHVVEISWDGEGPTGRTDLEFRVAMVSVCFLVPLLEGSTMKKEVIR